MTKHHPKVLGQIEEYSAIRGSKSHLVNFEKNGKTGFCLSLLAIACRESDSYTCSEYHISMKLLQNVERRILYSRN